MTAYGSMSFAKRSGVGPYLAGGLWLWELRKNLKGLPCLAHMSLSSPLSKQGSNIKVSSFREPLS